MKRFFQISLLFIFVWTFCFAESNAQNRREDQPLSDELYKVLEEKDELVKQDLSASKDKAWVGVYYQGTHHPTEFAVTPNAGFLVTSSHHTFSPSWLNYGKVEFADNRLRIYPELEKENQYAHLMPTEFVYIRWDETHFMIPPDKLIDFAYAVHSDSEHQIMQFFARGMYSNASRKGLPDLPQEYRRILTMKAIKPIITAIKKSKKDYIWKDEITLNLGSADNVIKGMVFYNSSSNGEIKLLIIDLQKHTAKARIIGISNEAEPKVGMKFISKKPEDIFED